MKKDPSKTIDSKVKLVKIINLEQNYWVSINKSPEKYLLIDVRKQLRKTKSLIKLSKILVFLIFKVIKIIIEKRVKLLYSLR